MSDARPIYAMPSSHSGCSASKLRWLRRPSSINGGRLEELIGLDSGSRKAHSHAGKSHNLAVHVDREKVIAFRLESHNLAKRLPPRALAKAAAACGIRNTPPWAGPYAMIARVQALSADQIERAVSKDRTLVQIWSLRIVPCFVPASDLPVFTTALLPQDEAAARSVLPRITAGLDALGISAFDALELTSQAIRKVLHGRQLTCQHQPAAALACRD